MTTNTIGVHWFRHDLRINDNQALLSLSQAADRIVGVYIHDPSWQVENDLGFAHMGAHRRAFIDAALLDLQANMQALGAPLLILQGAPVDILIDILRTLKATHLSYEAHSGVHENEQIRTLKAKIHSTNSTVSVITGSSHYLYEQSELPFALENMPDTFSPFRRKVEKYAKPRNALAPPDTLLGADVSAVSGPHLLTPSLTNDLTNHLTNSLTNPPTNQRTDDSAQAKQQHKSINDKAINDKANEDSYPAGESGALERINEYFYHTDNIARYKETRNGLDGWDFSSRLSAYLAHGCVSPAMVLAKLKDYEQNRVANDSTYWLFFELLWREFFHWQLYKHKSRFFAHHGIQNKVPTGSHKPEVFRSWCEGETGYDIVDACMRQLNATGFMSNRGRQLVASCFVHELGLDWRYGATYFEQQLIDFDVASNWGNWQYLAGVGSDPRGLRQFNLQKQTETYDPQRRFIDKWLLD